MKQVDIIKIRKEMETIQKSSRFEHTLGVAYTAASLAMCYGLETERAIVAGYLHDCAKHMSDEELLKLCKKYDLTVSDVEKKNPSLLHGKVGAYLAKNTYGIEDEEILRAICFHTTGHPNMTILEKIIFLADYMEPGRDKAPNLSLIRKLVYEDLDKGLVKVLEDTLVHLKQSDKPVDDLTQQTYDFYAK